ncbi:MAG TPA: hypothetical protein VK541_20545 [Pedobacter sp.]|uniref:hypothetical protein n=1 Tax=Pedobacter sp. TaxID=1411316 RepID=UPI002C663A23|nr:hypothetical protein [Pedobacter sp.]HMI04890.1 hypothetical protein [Pedobacter sp.]
MKLNIKNLIGVLVIIFSTNTTKAATIPLLHVAHFNSLKHANVIPDFSGRWKLNIQNSSFGKIPLTAAFEVLEVLQTKDSVSIMNIGDASTKQTIALNGNSFTKSVKNKRTKKSVVSWIDDNQTMVQNSSFEYEDSQDRPHQISAVEVYKLSKDGKVLTIEKSVLISDPKLNWKIIAAYDRQ